MKKTYLKIIIREIKKSLGRFIAIFAIVALGVGFLAGLLSTTPDMQKSVDAYYDKNNTADIFIKATMGLTQADIDVVSNLYEVEQIMPAYVTDTLMKTDDDQVLATRIYGLPLEKLQNGDDAFINRLELTHGRMPQSQNECLIEQSGSYLSEIPLGSSLIVSEENEDYETIGDIYKTTEYTVVGIVSNPFYFALEREPSTIGNGRIGAIIYVDESCYALDVYTDLYLKVAGASDLNAFHDEYDSYINDVVDYLSLVGQMQSMDRYHDIIDEATEELDKAKAELAEAKADAEKELSDAYAKITDGKAEIKKGELELADAKEKLSDGETKLANERAKYKKKIRSSESQLKDGQKELDAAKTILSDNKVKLDAAKESVEQAKALLATGATLPDEVLAQIKEYDQGLAAYESANQQLSEKQAELDDAKVSLKNGKRKAEAQFKKAEDDIAEGREEIKDGEAELKKAKKELSEGEEEYLKGKKEADDEFKKAELEIADAEKQISDIELPKWHVLDLSSNISFYSFSMNAKKVAAIATVFPVFFFLVAALVALTTMTRMVEEERTQIGTLKALGYTKGAIMFKYIIYCGLASVLGGIVGLAAGFQLLPTVIWSAYGTMYHLPPLVTQFNWSFAIIASALAILCTMVSTISACQHAMKEKPAALMLPRAPKAGKRIFLERIFFIWSRMRFTYKATARNLMRYKKHFYMTVIGIAGCTALIVAGFGMSDSLGSIAKKQYNQIFLYDLLIEMEDTNKVDTILGDFLKDPSRVESYMEVYKQAGDVSLHGESISTSIYVPKEVERFTDFINLAQRKSKFKGLFDNRSVIMTEKLADKLQIQIGNTFTIKNADGKTAQFILSGIAENYVGNYLYVNPGDYASAFNDEPSYNTLLVKTLITDTTQYDKILTNIQASESVSSSEFVSQTKKSYDNLLASVNFIVVILILAAGALAIIVLYNLINININERKKELATLRVLGFHNFEVAGYIFREISILSVIGTMVGIVLGVLLHTFIIRIAESTDMMFGRSISGLSFVYSAAITLLFSILVQLFMFRKLKKIEMVDSMKAID